MFMVAHLQFSSQDTNQLHGICICSVTKLLQKTLFEFGLLITCFFIHKHLFSLVHWNTIFVSEFEVKFSLVYFLLLLDHGIALHDLVHDFSEVKETTVNE